MPAPMPTPTPTPTQVRIRLDPLTASEEDKKYVSLSLEMDFPRGYPDKEPNIQVS